MQGYNVMFLTGTDEHGLKIEQKAAEAAPESGGTEASFREAARQAEAAAGTKPEEDGGKTAENHEPPPEDGEKP